MGKSKEEILGEYFIPPTCKDKQLYIDTINKFINSVPNFKPIVKNNNMAFSKMLFYAESNNYKLLDIRMLTNNLSSDLKGGYWNGKSIEVMVDKNNVKHIILIRTLNGKPKEMSVSLSLNTLVSIYNGFVLNMETPTKNLRLLKEAKNFFDNIEYPHYIQRESSFSNLKYEFVKEVKVDIRDCSLKLRYDLISINKSSLLCEVNRDRWINRNDFASISNLMKNHKLIDNETIKKDVSKLFETRQQEIENDRIRTMSMF